MDDVNANDVVAFLVEIVAFVGLGVWGWHSGETVLLRWGQMLGVILIAGVLWALFVSPRATFDVPVLALVLKVAILGAGALALGTVTSALWGAVFAVIAGVNTLLSFVGPFARG